MRWRTRKHLRYIRPRVGKPLLGKELEPENFETFLAMTYCDATYSGDMKFHTYVYWLIRDLGEDFGEAARLLLMPQQEFDCELKAPRSKLRCDYAASQVNILLSTLGRFLPRKIDVCTIGDGLERIEGARSRKESPWLNQLLTFKTIAVALYLTPGVLLSQLYQRFRSRG